LIGEKSTTEDCQLWLGTDEGNPGCQNLTEITTDVPASVEDHSDSESTEES
jgi:hypothetical protein